MSDGNWVSLVLPLAIVLIVVARRIYVATGSGGKAKPGLVGAAVCRHCGRPFPRPLWAPNLVVGKVLRCPHCGAWGVLPAASPAELEVAEARDLASIEAATPPQDPDAALRRRIDESRFENRS